MGQAARKRTRSLTELRLHAEVILRGLKRDRKPVLITSGGRTQAVLQDASSYEASQERLRLLESILRGLRAEARGEVVSHQEAMRQLDKLLDA